MKIAFVVHNELFTARVMELLAASGIDYYTRWEQVLGKGHGTEPHL
ncbi:MAG: transcriptional regulator, partial [Betaproteobacteria bacterium]|nr:transcriptional regulator [Betaproteobacteria bacterium]